MNQIDLHIQDHLNSFISSNKYDYINKQSENIALSNQVIKELGEYFLALISCFLSVQKSSELSVLHVHIDSDLSFDNKVYLGRLINVVFFNHLHSRALDDKNNSYLKKINQELKARDIALRTIPAKASGNNRVAKQWKKDKKKNRSLISFYQEYSEKKIDFGMLFNSQVKYVNRLFESFENYPFALSLESKGNLQSHNILNSTNTLSDIDEIDQRICFKMARNGAIKWFSINHGQFPSADWDEYRDASCARLSPPQIGAVLTDARHIKGCRQVDFRNPIAE